MTFQRACHFLLDSVLIDPRYVNGSGIILADSVIIGGRMLLRLKSVRTPEDVEQYHTYIKDCIKDCIASTETSQRDLLSVVEMIFSNMIRKTSTEAIKRHRDKSRQHTATMPYFKRPIIRAAISSIKSLNSVPERQMDKGEFSDLDNFAEI